MVYEPISASSRTPADAATACGTCSIGMPFIGWRSSTSTHTAAPSSTGGVSRPAPSSSSEAVTACAAFAHCATPLSAMAAKNFAEMVNLGYLKTTDSLQEVARGMSAGVLLVTAKLTRHNKAGAYQTLTVQFKLIPQDAKLPLDKLLITEAWAKENHLLTQGSAKPATSGKK